MFLVDNSTTIGSPFSGVGTFIKFLEVFEIGEETWEEDGATN